MRDVREEAGLIVCDDLGEPEGPVLLADGSWLVTELRPDRGCVTRISAAGSERHVIARTGRPNGLALDRDGVLWVAESGSTPSVVALTLDGRELRRFTTVAGEPMLWPNDICVGPDRFLYVTDSGMLVGEHLPNGRLRDDYATATYRGRVYRIDPATGDGTVLDDGLRFPNGIAFGPSGNLFVSETLTGNVYVYRRSSGSVWPRSLFGNVIDGERELPGLRGPDGMAFSDDGRLWIAVFGQADVTVLRPDGSVSERIPTRGREPANVAFGPPGSGTVVVTEHQLGCLEVLAVDATPLPLYA
jgi:gluconolactonase